MKANVASRAEMAEAAAARLTELEAGPGKEVHDDRAELAAELGTPSQCLAIQVDTSIGGATVVAVLERLALTRRLPKTITVDNGPEFTGKAFHLWAQCSGVTLHHIQPGKPMQNAFIESFNGTCCDDCLNQH